MAESQSSKLPTVTGIKQCAAEDADRKTELQAHLAFTCDEYELCVAALGATHPRCLVWLSIKQQIEAELKIVCSKLELWQVVCRPMPAQEKKQQ